MIEQHNSVDLIDLTNYKDERGKIVILDKNSISTSSTNSDTFFTKRAFYIYDVTAERGEHAHFETRQLLIALNGSCKVTLDNGSTKETVSLNDKTKGLFQDKLIFGTMHDFSEDCILLVLADTEYEESDYIRSYDKFLDVVRNKSQKEQK